MADNKHALWFTMLVVFALSSYGLYSETRKDLERAQEEIARLVSQNEERVSEEGNEALVQEVLDSIKEGEVETQEASLNSLLNEFAPSVVRLECLANSTFRTRKQGSGVLYKDKNGDNEPYYIQTNLHVVESNDGSPSQCVIFVFPDSGDSQNYKLFVSSGYRFFEQGVDLAFIEPRVTDASSRAGSQADLEKFARDEDDAPICNSVSIGSHVSVLGYPGIGGDSLTVTDGIISGFEFRSGVRYIKVSAKIDQGNSGGVVIEDSGCVVGIPTFLQTQIESLGRVLDLSALLN